MRNRFSVGLLVLATLVVCGGLAQTACAWPNGRTLVMGRQQVRAELAVAMADGLLTRPEYQRVLMTARRWLSKEESEQVRQTLVRRYEETHPRRTPTPAGRAGANTSSPARSQTMNATPTAGRVADANKLTAIHWLVDDAKHPTTRAGYDAPEEVKPGVPLSPIPAESPFQAEGPAISYGNNGQLSAHGTGGGNCYQGCAEGCGGGDCCGGNYCGDYCGGCCPRACGLIAPGTFSPWNPKWIEGWKHIRFSTTVEAFKGPMDLDNQNGNFGFGFAVNGGFPLSEWRGIGLQVGTSAVLADLQGTQFTGDDIRSQNFTTVGLFQRVCSWRGTYLKWGFVFDWMFDDYYATLNMSQWRVQLACELNPCSEIGMWACIPNDGDSVYFGEVEGQGIVDRFEPVAQGSFYWRQCWANEASLTGYLGIAEQPGEVIFGGRARMPFSPRLSLIGKFNYMLPSASGINGQGEEMWYVSLGIEFTPGVGGNRCRDNRFTPLMPLADNGIFAIKRE